MSEKQRILAVCAAPSFVSFLLPIWDYMASLGHETHIVTARDASARAGVQLGPHQLHTIPIERNLSPGRDLLALTELTALLHRLKPSVVHAHGPKACLLGMLAATAAQVPVRVASIHGLRHETLLGPKLTLVKNLESVSARLAHRVVCVSESVKRRALADGILNPAKARILAKGSAAGVDAEGVFDPAKHRSAGIELRRELGLGRDDLVVGYVGRFAHDKGLIELSQAWQTVVEQCPRTHLFLVGERDSTDPVELASLLMLPRVHQLGYLKYPAQAYAAFDALVLPSYREGFPQVLLEAAAMEVPVVATQVTGCVDAVVQGVTGLLVPPRDAPSLARAIVQLLDDPERRAAMGSRARERVLADYRIEPIARATWELYEDLLLQHPRSLSPHL